MPLTVVMDTNFLTLPAQFNVDIFYEAERVLERKLHFILLESVMKELVSNLEHETKKHERRKFKIALELAKRCETIESEGLVGPVDDQILEYTIQIGGVLATNDRELRKKARDAGIPVLYLRNRTHLDIEGKLV